MNPFLEVSVVFIIATLLAFFMRRLRLPLLVGYLATGVVAGPLGLGIIQAHERLQVFSELGISALLFIIGLTLSPHVLREIGRTAVTLGLAQGVCTAIPAFFLGRWFGLDPLASVYLAVALTLSSTIVVSKILSDKKALGTLHGKLTIGFLLVQDVMAAFVLLVMSSLGRGEGTSGLIVSLLVTLCFFVVLYAFSRWLLPRLTSFFASAQDILFLFSLGWGIGIAGIFSLLGLSFELGALTAGITLASSPYHHELGMRMRVVRDFFLVVFFALLGSELTTPFGHLSWGFIIALCAFVFLAKPLIVMLLMRLLGFQRKVSFLTGVSIAQVSEFSFILITLGVGLKHLPAALLPLFILVGMITIAVSALWLSYGERIYEAGERYVRLLLGRESSRTASRGPRFSPRVILIGCHRTGAPILARLERWKESFLVVDFDPGIIKALQARGIPCVYGDASEQDLLEEVGLGQADIVISTVPEPGVARAMLRHARQGKRPAIVILTASSTEQALALYKEGATYVVNLHDIGGTYTAEVLEEYRVDPTRLRRERRRHISELTRAFQDRAAVATELHHRWVHLHE